MTTTQTNPELDPSSPEWGTLVNTALEQYSTEERSRSSLDGNPQTQYFRYALAYYCTDDGSISNESLSTSHGRGDFTVEFFRALIQTDEGARAEALRTMVDMLTESLHSTTKDLLRAHLRTIVRFAFEVPFADITDTFQSFLKTVEQSGEVVVPKPVESPSSFIPNSIFLPVNTDDEAMHRLFVDVFLQAGRVTHLNRVMALHPSYFEKYYTTYNFIMREPGPLPFEWRNYIAILAAARHRCKWLVNWQQQEFLMNGGNPKWLEGLDHIPLKLHSLLEVNQILSHQPWLLTKDHIAPLVKGEDSWSIGELVHAMIVICTFKSLAGIIFGCGVTPEVDFSDMLASKDLASGAPQEHDDQASNATMDADTQKIMNLLQSGWQQEESEQPQEQLFVNAETSEGTAGSFINNNNNFNNWSGMWDISRFVGKYSLQHVDFDVKSKNYNIFRSQDYCWKEDGFELVRRFLPGAATLLDEEFDHIYTMTYHRFNQSENVDTFPFRRAVWQYVQRIKGVFHDDYNYQEVNIFLNVANKSYIKKIACFPDTITRNDFVNLGYQLKPDEKVHIALLSVESAKQSELLYGLHAVMKYMYNQ